MNYHKSYCQAYYRLHAFFKKKKKRSVGARKGDRCVGVEAWCRNHMRNFNMDSSLKWGTFWGLFLRVPYYIGDLTKGP